MPCSAQKNEKVLNLTSLWSNWILEIFSLSWEWIQICGLGIIPPDAFKIKRSRGPGMRICHNEHLITWSINVWNSSSVVTEHWQIKIISLFHPYDTPSLQVHGYLSVTTLWTFVLLRAQYELFHRNVGNDKRIWWPIVDMRYLQFGRYKAC